MIVIKHQVAQVVEDVSADAGMVVSVHKWVAQRLHLAQKLACLRRLGGIPVMAGRV